MLFLEQLGLNMAAHWGYALAGILLTLGGAEAVWGGGKFDNFIKVGEYTGRPVGGALSAYSPYSIECD